ncbi:sulfatase [Akkermansiaceae bacterium]|nr:sulfatase [Akkermansiaceae bacterium]MDB4730742.1 sulfatase [Akkermansiaceae bacterium]MDB4752916.1 sulfatase [bacterium]
MTFTRLLLACLLFSITAHAKQDKPNIVWIVSEDNSAKWLRLYNEGGAPMPYVERLARVGITFNNAFSCAPVCSVARSTIISGCYAPRLGAQYHRKQATVAMPDGLKMFPWYLRKNGYHTTNNSKEDYNFHPADKKGVWDASSRKANYKNRKPGQPFFHVQNFGTTHEGKTFGDPLKFQLKTDPAKVRLAAYHPDTPVFRRSYAHYLDNHMTVDTQIGAFLKKLEIDGLLDDTFIFYYGDHGGVMPGSKGYANESGLRVPMVVSVPKNWQHLAPTPTRTRVDGFVEFVDLSATVLNLAGVEIPTAIDGKPFLGKGVTLEELNKRDQSFGYADRFDEKYDLVRTLRKGKFRYSRNYQPFNFDGLYNEYRYKQTPFAQWRELYLAGKLNAAQEQFFKARPAETLYDLSSDPDEVKNLASDPAHQKTLLELRALLQKRLKGMPDLSFYPEPVFLKTATDNPVAFGQKHKSEIAKLIETADLSLKSFEEAKERIATALDSKNPWERYWGLIVCSSFGKQAAPFYEQAKKLAADDAEPLVRTRAAEFLGLTGQQDPRPVLTEVLNATEDHILANLILNTVVVLQDSKPGYKFDASKLTASWVNNKKAEVASRVLYLK